MSRRAVYALAIIIMGSTLLFALGVYDLDRQHQMEATVKDHMESWKLKSEPGASRVTTTEFFLAPNPVNLVYPI